MNREKFSLGEYLKILFFTIDKNLTGVNIEKLWRSFFLNEKIHYHKYESAHNKTRKAIKKHRLKWRNRSIVMLKLIIPGASNGGNHPTQ